MTMAEQQKQDLPGSSPQPQVSPVGATPEPRAQGARKNWKKILWYAAVPAVLLTIAIFSVNLMSAHPTERLPESAGQPVTVKTVQPERVTLRRTSTQPAT